MKATFAQQVALQGIRDSASPVVIGIDEVGLGAVAGPMVVAAAACHKEWSHKDVKDSKKYSSIKSRKRADALVRASALSYCIFAASHEEIDRDGSRETLERLTSTCMEYLLQFYPTAIIVQDGDTPITVLTPSSERKFELVWLPKADALVPSVSAASVLAKTYRDEFMLELSYVYTGYGFGTNMGYLSKQHREALAELGPSPIHRRSIRYKV